MGSELVFCKSELVELVSATYITVSGWISGPSRAYSMPAFYLLNLAKVIKFPSKS